MSDEPTEYACSACGEPVKRSTASGDWHHVGAEIAAECRDMRGDRAWYPVARA